MAVNRVNVIIVRKSEFDQLVYPPARQHLDSVLAYYGLLPSFGLIMCILETTE